MTKLNAGFISLGALSIIGASGFGIHKAINKDNTDVLKNKADEVKKVDFPEIKKPFKNIDREEPEVFEFQKNKNFDLNLPKVEEEIPPKSEIINRKKSEKRFQTSSRYNSDFGSISSNFSKVRSEKLLEGLPDGSIGSRFSDYFIDSSDDQIWDKKTTEWKEGYERRLLEESLYNPFTPRNLGYLQKQFLINRCKGAYRKNNWGEDLIMSNSAISSYWKSVVSFCGKENVKMPENWKPDLN